MLATQVLDDELLSLWHQFKHGNQVDNRLLEKFLRYYHPPHLTNIAQLERCGITDGALQQQLAQSGLISQTLEVLATQTRLQIVLSHLHHGYPYISINNRAITTELNYSFQPREPRLPLHQHLQALMTNAKVIVLADKYLDKHSDTALRFIDLLPDACTLCLTHELSSDLQRELKQRKTGIKFKHDNRSGYAKCHDRYLLIDNQIEVILTSGMDYLFDTSKECTAIIRLASAEN